MIRQLILSTFSLLLTTTVFAQMPEAVMGTGKLGQANGLLKMACADQNAGTITFGTFTGSSNDTDEATPIFLCLGDTYQINHDGNQDLTGDPQMGTDAGITYAFYSGVPTVTGPNLSSILTDPNLILNSSQQTPIFITGTSGSNNGDILLQNAGIIQGNMDIGGDGGPLQLWFAPITIDDFSNVLGTSGWENVDINDPDSELGPCVNANVDEAFSVVFLNEITGAEQEVFGTCGRLRIRGGLSEFDGNNYTTITIVNADNPAIIGDIVTNNVEHNDLVAVSVPSPGNYNIIVEDEKGCDAIIPMTFTAETPDLELLASNETSPPGGSVCVTVTANNFIEIVTIQTTINYDGTVLDFTGFDNLNPSLPDLTGALVNNAANTAILVAWVDPATNGINLPDGSPLFDICFDVIGTGNDVSPLAFDESININEITNPCGVGSVNLASTDGSVMVTLTSFDVVISDIIDESCDNANNGQFTITASGGTADFDISWVGAATGPNTGSPVITMNGGSFTAMGLEPDDYTITVEDMNGDIVTENVTIGEGFNFGVALDYTSPTCADDCDGSMVATILVNGIAITPGPEYTFMWSTGETTQSLANLCNASGADYGVTVTGPGMCEEDANESVSDVLPITINADVVNATCTGINDGSIPALNIMGGSGNYNTVWINPPFAIADGTTSLTGDVPAGIYEIFITDDNMCSNTVFVEVGTNRTVSINETIIDINCNGDENGSISVIASTSGGPPSPYEFNWFPVSLTPVTVGDMSTISNLSAGNYQLILNNAEDCTINQIFTIEEPMVLDITEVQTTAESCTIGMDGTATIAVTGGVYPYQYDWNVVGQTDSTAVGLEAGMYIVTVTDANMCTGTLEVNIDAPVPPVVNSLDDTTVDCNNGTDGTLTLDVVDGSSPITGILWSNGETTAVITDLTPGQYEVTISAGDGCTTLDTALVLQPDPLAVSELNIESTNCPGSGGGLVSVILEGGVQPYNFNWSNGTMGDNVSTITGGDIVAGDYTVTITYSDSNNNSCPDSLVLNATVPEPPSINADFTGIDAVSCYNLSGVPADGEATITPFYEGDPGNTAMQNWNITWQTLGNDPTIFFQENGVLSSSAINLPQDEQFVIVSDGQCFDTLSVNIPAPPPLLATGSTTDVSCSGDTDGAVSVMGEGGTGAYMYQWSTGDVNVTTVDNQPPGEITVVITDENNCNFTFLADVGEPQPFVVDTFVDSQLAVSCHSGSDAIISLFTTGGNPGILTYDWEDNIAAQNESVAQNVGAGAWSVTVTDERGCMDDLTVLITEPDTILFTYSVDTIQCNGGEAEFRIDTVTGGTADGFIEYMFSLNNSPQLNVNTEFEIGAAEYTVSVFDNNGCEVSETFTLTEPNPLTVILPEEIEVELGDTLTQLLPTIINDFPLDSILWTPAMSGLSNDTILNPFIRNSVDDQVYTLTLFDINGCTGSDQVRVDIDRNRNVYIPNVFSPNNDGYNDKFGVFGCLGVSKIVSAQVYDRWGELVAVIGTDGLLPECESPNGTVIWDGMFRGKRAPDGVYVYVIDIEFLDEKRLVYRGDVTVLK